ncbi:hypothetical protein B0H13DRAFT_1855163 [Mycena leptocephala]|nr:hypothetical protein B0H13DRAFT_1855163 [Mycena leptocephala]
MPKSCSWKFRTNLRFGQAPQSERDKAERLERDFAGLWTTWRSTTSGWAFTTFWGGLGQGVGRGPRPTSANPLARPSRSRLVDLGFDSMPILWYFPYYQLLEKA